MPRFRVFTAALAAITGLGLAIAPADAAPTPVSSGGLSAKTVAQIDALARAKIARTPAQQKVDSRLLTEIAQRAGHTAAPGVGRLKTGVRTDKQGLTPVTVRGAATAAADQVRAYGGRVLGVYSRDGAVRADVPLAAVEKLAGSADVTQVEIADQYVLADALTAPPVGGSVTSQGDVTHAADLARARFEVTGVGVKVAVLSDGVDSLEASIATGDLPPDVQVLPGQAGSGDEGTAMLEIVHIWRRTRR